MNKHLSSSFVGVCLATACMIFSSCGRLSQTENRLRDEKVETTVNVPIERFDKDLRQAYNDFVKDENSNISKANMIRRENNAQDWGMIATLRNSNPEFKNLTDELDADLQKHLAKLTSKYGSFMDMYSIKELEIGPFSEPGARFNLCEFLSNQGYMAFYDAVDSVYANGMDGENEKVNILLSRFKHFFPDKTLPKRIIGNMSGFYSNMSVNEEEELGISLEYYIGSDTTTFNSYYRWVDGIYDYQRLNLTRDKIAPDIAMGWLMYQFPMDALTNIRLIDELIYNGKIVFATEALLPDETEQNLMGYSKDQLDWCYANEKQMWDYIKKYNHLFSFDRLVISKYINPAPTTQYFPEDSPGKTGIWLGAQIVRSYMKNNPDVTLEQLMNDNDSQKILKESKYNP